MSRSRAVLRHDGCGPSALVAHPSRVGGPGRQACTCAEGPGCAPDSLRAGAGGGFGGGRLSAFLLWPKPLNSKTVCIYTGSDISALTAFSKLAGRPVNCAVLYNDANPEWSQWVSPWFTHPKEGDAYWPQWIKADPAVRRVVVTQEMVPDNVPDNWRVLGAEGAYDRYARSSRPTS